MRRVGPGVLLVDHDMNLVFEVCDCVYVLDYGAVIAAGTPDAVRADPAVHRGLPRIGDRAVTPLLSLRGVTAGYDGVPAVRDLDLDLAEGEMLALLGPNGAGKTTTLLTAVGVLATAAREPSPPSASPLHRRRGAQRPPRAGPGSRQPRCLPRPDRAARTSPWRGGATPGSIRCSSSSRRSPG